MGKKGRRGKRGYEKLLLLSLSPMQAHLWQIYSVKVKILHTIQLGCKWKNASETQLYNFFEDILTLLRPILDDGIRSLLITSPIYPEYPAQLIQHLQNRHHWLFSKNTLDQGHRLSIETIEGSSKTEEETHELLQREDTIQKIEKVLQEEADNIISLLDNCLEDENCKVCINFKEIESLILPKKKFRRIWANYLIYNEEFLEKLTPKEKNRFNRICAIARNKDVKQRIIPKDCPAAERLDTIGGIACFLKYDPRFEVI